MLLPCEDVKLFFRLQYSLLHFANQRLQTIQPGPDKPDDFFAMHPNDRLKIRDALYAQPSLIETFVADNPAHLSESELAIVRPWRHFVAGSFYVFRELKKFTVFLSAHKPLVAYGVLALSQPFEELVGPHLPLLTRTVLLPFKDRIVYDGILSTQSISFGAGIRRMLNDSFRRAKEEHHGIVASLRMSEKVSEPTATSPVQTAQPPAARSKAKPRTMANPKEETAVALKTIVGMTDQFCNTRLNAEYAGLCRKLAETLARKRPSPLPKGKPEVWACAIIRTIGWANFLDDKGSKLHVRFPEIDDAFGVSGSTSQQKAKAIRDMLKISQFDWHWMLAASIESNPMVWTVEFNGLLMDIRTLPREVQEEAVRKGIIPYVPEVKKPNPWLRPPKT